MTIGEEEPGGGKVGTSEDSEKEIRWHLRSQSGQKCNSTPKSASSTPVTPFQQRGGKRVLSSPDETERTSDTRKRLRYLNVLKLHILLPNATSVDVILNLAEVNTLDAVIKRIREANNPTNPASGSKAKTPSRDVLWEGGNLVIQTLAGDIVGIPYLANLAQKRTSTSNTFMLLDGLDHDSSWVDENLWNVTPKPEMLGQLPQGYTLETALADQVDNALQAVWPNQDNSERRLVRIDLGDDKISIFDTGQGMDSSPENCIANWGTVGGSTHRSVHHKGIGGDPPYLKPYLGKYGAGGVAAALHLGGCVTVWSKTKQSKMVVTLKLEQKDLVQKHKLDPEQGVWRTRGELREMTKMEKERAPHGSFTRVEISKLRSQYCIKGSNQYWKVEKVKQLMKDIYFPYIQSETASRTITPVEFEVNGTNLLEVTDCEVAIANQHTCIGAPFVFSIHMKRQPEDRSVEPQPMDEANARITCHYFPIQRGKEALETVLEEVSKLRPGTPVTFETMHRVVVRWLGRLLPEAKWNILPFMEVTAKKEQRFHVRQQWAKRVRAYVETDAGFQPNQSKLELDRDHPFTLALKQLGSDNLSEILEAEVQVDIKFGGKNKAATSMQLVEAYLAWLEDMHKKYDEEVTFLDDAEWLVSHPNADTELGVYKQVIVFHKRLKDTTGEWHINDENPLRVKFLRGAGSLKNELYATLEYFFKEGDDEHGEVKILCRAIDVDDSEGCKLHEKNGRLCFELKRSQWLPGSALSGGKCQRVDPVAWRKKLDELVNKAPGYIDILEEEDLQKFDFKGAFPASGSKFEAGYTLPPEVLVVVRPKKGTGASHKQGMIVSEPMSIHVTVTHCKCTGLSCRVSTKNSALEGASSSVDEHAKLMCKLIPRSIVTKTGVKGLYSFNVGSSHASRLTKQGTYTFHFSLESEKGSAIKTATCTIRVVPSRKTSKWQLSTQAKVVSATASVPSTLVIRLNEKYRDDLFLRKYDEYGNPQSFDKAMPVEVKIVTPSGESLGMTQKVTAHIAVSEGRLQGGGLQIKGLLFSGGQLKSVEPTYNALLRVYVSEEQYGEMTCRVLPGTLASVRVKDSIPPVSIDTLRLQEPLRAGDKVEKFLSAKDIMCFDEQLRPGEIVKRLTLQGLDASGNKIDKDQKMQVKIKGLGFQDNLTEEREVDDNGCVHLGGLLQVTAQHNSRGFIGVLSEAGKHICTIGFKTVIRKLIATQVPSKSFVGRDMEGITVKIVDQFGTVDTEIDGYSHTVSVDWQQGVAFPFVKGECILPPVRVPDKPGWWKGRVRFSANQSLCVELKVELELSIGCKLGNPPNRYDEVLVARCGTAFEFPFWVADERGHLALLPETIKNTIVVKAEAHSSAGDDTPESYPRPCTVTCSNIVRSDKDGAGYKADVVLTGDVGIYSLVMIDTSLKCNGEVNYICKLNPGKVSQLVVDIHHSETRQQFGQKEVHIPVHEEFPKVGVTLLDSEGNLCTYCEGKNVRMAATSCSEFKAVTGKISKGTATFKPFTLDIPVGTYNVCVSLDTPDSLEYSFRLVVEHGAYPSALRLIDSDDLIVALGGADEQVRLPTMRIEVESASGAKVQWRKLSVGLRIVSKDPVPVHMSVPDASEFLGTAIDSYGPESKRQEDNVSSSGGSLSRNNSVRYEFRGVIAPTTAGVYSMAFFIRDIEVDEQYRHLRVQHGPPYKLEIVRGLSGEALEVLQVNLLDAYGNKCDSVSGIEISLRFGLSQTFSLYITPTASGLEPCCLESRKSSTIFCGKADFGPFILTDGLPAVYVLEVSAENAALISAEVQIFVTRGEPTESIRQQLVDVTEARSALMEYAKLFTSAQEQAGHRRREREFLSQEVEKLAEEKTFLLQAQHEVRELQLLHGDDALLDAEDKQHLRAEGNVISDLVRLGRSGNNAALLFMEAQSESNFLSPEKMGREIVGLFVLLARVESNLLNRALIEFLGVGTLLLMVCRTQRGVGALEEYHEDGQIDESKGLHGFARSRSRPLPRKFEGFALTDSRTFRRGDGKPPVLLEHPQKLLNIDPPILPSTNKPPRGFLGYAVNLLHLKDEHLGGTVQRFDDQSPGEPLNLRQSVFYHFLQNLQVYDTRAHMLTAKGEIRFSGGAVSLDGGLIRPNQRQQLGRRSDNVPVSFANLEKEERLWSSLMPPACDAFRRMSEYNRISREISERDEELAVKLRELGNCDAILQGVVENAERLGSQYDVMERSASLRQRAEELGKAEKLFLHQSDDVGRYRTYPSANDLLMHVAPDGRQTVESCLSIGEYENRRMRAFVM